MLLIVATAHAHNAIVHVSQAVASAVYHIIVFLFAPNDHHTVCHADFHMTTFQYDAPPAEYTVHAHIHIFQNHTVHHVQEFVHIIIDSTSFVAFTIEREPKENESVHALFACADAHIANHLVGEALRKAFTHIPTVNRAVVIVLHAFVHIATILLDVVADCAAQNQKAFIFHHHQATRDVGYDHRYILFGHGFERFTVLTVR